MPPLILRFKSTCLMSFSFLSSSSSSISTEENSIVYAVSRGGALRGERTSVPSQLFSEMFSMSNSDSGSSSELSSLFFFGVFFLAGVLFLVSFFVESASSFFFFVAGFFLVVAFSLSSSFFLESTSSFFLEEVFFFVEVVFFFLSSFLSDSASEAPRGAANLDFFLGFSSSSSELSSLRFLFLVFFLAASESCFTGVAFLAFCFSFLSATVSLTSAGT
mmetsp:Transcript_9777/g.36469  ORF Transcript_9777/g.36469 Transcript_9777/m.36469 type:complete len:218 (-) Transcript_9777:580-1233(-)